MLCSLVFKPRKYLFRAEFNTKKKKQLMMFDCRTWICCNCSPRRRAERCSPVTIDGEDRRRPPPCLESPLRGWREAEDHRVQSARRPRHPDNGNQAPNCTKKLSRFLVLPVRWLIAARASIVRWRMERGMIYYKHRGKTQMLSLLSHSLAMSHYWQRTNVC